MNNLKLFKQQFARLNYSSVSVTTLEQWKSINDSFGRKIKGTFFEKWVKYWKQLAKDYRDVAISLKQESKEKPLKATGYILGLGVLGYSIKSNPNLKSFRAKYVQCSNDLSLVSSVVANPEAVEHLKYIERCFNANLIRYMNLGILSIIWVDEYSSECNVYETNCSYLQVPYRKLHERIIDVGFLNIWWNISKKMLDYDINY